MKCLNLLVAFVALAAAAPTDPPVVHPVADPKDVKCNTAKKGARSKSVFGLGVPYLRGVKGQPELGPGKCSRVSCAWDSAVYWCNDSKDVLHLESFGMIADGALAIGKVCDAKNHKKVSGRTIYDKWSVKVERAEC